jgi:hypothetical protein
MVVPHCAVSERKVERLVCAYWGERQVEKELKLQDQRRGSVPVNWPSSASGLSDVQERLCRVKLERAKLEVEFYAEALKQPTHPADIGTCTWLLMQYSDLLIGSNADMLVDQLDQDCGMTEIPAGDGAHVYTDSAEEELEEEEEEEEEDGDDNDYDLDFM